MELSIRLGRVLPSLVTDDRVHEVNDALNELIRSALIIPGINDIAPRSHQRSI